MKKSLDYIYKTQKELSIFGGIGSLLDWDQKTYMPIHGNAERSDQISIISRLAHERVISDELWRNIKKLTNPGVINKLKLNDQIIIKKLQRDVKKARKIPPEFIEEFSKATTLAYIAWQKARKNYNFEKFSPYLEKIIKLQKKYIDYIGMPGHPYNSLLDDYEEGMNVEKLKKAFNYLKPQIIEILYKIKETELYKKRRDLEIKLDLEKQKKICNKLIKKMFIPSDRARIDISTHPFTTSIGNDDVRFTTNYKIEQPLFSFFSTMHEAGHALYDLGLPKGKYKYTVISDAPSTGLHESQSRFWENMIGRNPEFWKYFYPYFQKNFSNELKKIELETWIPYINRVKPSLIRIEADELTYNLHVLLRFEIELDLIEDNIKVSELPIVWRQKMNDLLEVIPRNDTEGVLQDVHWSTGSFGYFPTYAIGTIYSAQLFNQLLNEKKETLNEIKSGDFSNILSWLREHIHKYGRLMTAEETIKKTCGEGLNPKIFINYLKDKYYSIYQV